MGERVTAAKLNRHTKTAIENSVYNKPFCHITNTMSQSIPHATTTKALMNLVVEDNDQMADVGNAQIIIKTAGVYRVTYFAAFDNNSTGSRAMYLYRNATTILSGFATAAGTGFWRGNATWVVRLSVGDTLELRLNQQSGGALGTDTQYGGCGLMAQWEGL